MTDVNQVVRTIFEADLSRMKAAMGEARGVTYDLMADVGKLERELQDTDKRFRELFQSQVEIEMASRKRTFDDIGINSLFTQMDRDFSDTADELGYIATAWEEVEKAARRAAKEEERADKAMLDDVRKAERMAERAQAKAVKDAEKAAKAEARAAEKARKEEGLFKLQEDKLEKTLFRAFSFQSLVVGAVDGVASLAGKWGTAIGAALEEELLGTLPKLERDWAQQEEARRKNNQDYANWLEEQAIRRGERGPLTEVERAMRQLLGNGSEKGMSDQAVDELVRAETLYEEYKRSLTRESQWTSQRVEEGPNGPIFRSSGIVVDSRGYSRGSDQAGRDSIQRELNQKHELFAQAREKVESMALARSQLAFEQAMARDDIGMQIAAFDDMVANYDTLVAHSKDREKIESDNVGALRKQAEYINQMRNAGNISIGVNFSGFGMSEGLSVQEDRWRQEFDNAVSSEVQAKNRMAYMRQRAKETGKSPSSIFNINAQGARIQLTTRLQTNDPARFADASLKSAFLGVAARPLSAVMGLGSPPLANGRSR